MAIEKYIKNYINGALAPAISGKYLDNINPATGKVYSQFPNSNKDDLTQAITSAEKTFPAWSAMPIERRFRTLMRIADIIEQNLSDYARAESIDTGKPMAMSISQDIPSAQDYFRYYATALLHKPHLARYDEQGSLQFSLRQPIGIVGCIAPWTMPLSILCQKIAPALAAGNCIIAKPSELSPMTAYLLGQACEEAGLPKGVLNIIQGKDEELHKQIVQHPSIKAISFTGDTRSGKEIITAAREHFKKLAVNMGGNNSNIVFEDCDFDEMMLGTLRSSFSNNGHHSHHASRILVERSLYEKLKEELVKRTQFLKIGDPFSSVTDLGAITAEAQVEQLESLLEKVELEGGAVLCGGKRIKQSGDLEKGFFFRPTVLEGLSNDSVINQAPILGPIVSLQAFDTVEDAIVLANKTQYGLSASIWTKDSTKANELANRLKARTIWINDWLTAQLTVPSGGIIHSSFAMEGGQASLDFFTEEKTIVTKY